MADADSTMIVMTLLNDAPTLSVVIASEDDAQKLQRKNVSRHRAQHDSNSDQPLDRSSTIPTNIAWNSLGVHKKDSTRTITPVLELCV